MMSAPLPSTESAAGAISRVRYTHDAMADLLIQNPTVTNAELAKHFGYTEPWVSRILNSDAFQQRLAERKNDLIDPTIVRNIEHKLKALTDTAIDVVHDALARTRNPDMAFKALDMGTRALSYGARAQNVNLQAQFVVALPSKSESSDEWAAQHSASITIDQSSE